MYFRVFCPKQCVGFKPLVAHLHPNIGQVPPPPLVLPRFILEPPMQEPKMVLLLSTRIIYPLTNDREITWSFLWFVGQTQWERLSQKCEIRWMQWLQVSVINKANVYKLQCNVYGFVICFPWIAIYYHVERLHFRKCMSVEGFKSVHCPS